MRHCKNIDSTPFPDKLIVMRFFTFLLILCLFGLPGTEREVLMSLAIIVNRFVSLLSIYLLAFPSFKLLQVQFKVICSKNKTKRPHHHFISWMLGPLPCLLSFLNLSELSYICFIYYVQFSSLYLVIKIGKIFMLPSNKRKSLTFFFFFNFPVLVCNNPIYIFSCHFKVALLSLNASRIMWKF